MRALYLRTSTEKQDGDAQRAELQRAAWSRGWLPESVKIPPGEAIRVELIAGVYWFQDEHISGKRADRPAIEEIREMAVKGILRELLVKEISRLGRSTKHVLQFVEETTAAGLVIHSLDMGVALNPKDPIGKLLLTLNAAYAEMEHAVTARRVREGMEHARARGAQIGRPPRLIDPSTLELARRRLQSGWSWRKVSAAVKVPLATLRERLTDLQTEFPSVRKGSPARSIRTR